METLCCCCCCLWASALVDGEESLTGFILLRKFGRSTSSRPSSQLYAKYLTGLTDRIDRFFASIGSEKHGSKQFEERTRRIRMELS